MGGESPVKSYLARLGGLFRIREKVSLWEYLAYLFLPIVIFLFIWGALTNGIPEERVIPYNILPSPREVVEESFALFKSTATQKPFYFHLWISFRRISLGFLIACVLSLPIGFSMGAFERARAFFHPLALAGGYLPIPALVPLTMSIFKTDEAQKVVFLAIAFFVYLLPLVVQAVDKVDQVFLQTAYTLGASTWQAFTRVLISISWEDVYRAMRLGFGVGWSYILLAEMLILDKGLGEVIYMAQRRTHPEHIYFTLGAIILVAFGTDKLWEFGARKLFPHRRRS